MTPQSNCLFVLQQPQTILFKHMGGEYEKYDISADTTAFKIDNHTGNLLHEVHILSWHYT